MEENTDPFPWRDFIREFELAAARVVATLGDDRGAIVENVSKLLCWEGRLHTFEGRDDGPEEQELKYPGFPMPPQFNRAERRVPDPGLLE